MSGGSTSEEFVLIADLRCSSSAVYVVPIKLRKFSVSYGGGGAVAAHMLNLQSHWQAWLHN